MESEFTFLNLPKDELVSRFVQKLLKTNRGFNYYVNWKNAEAFKPFEIELHAMNVLIRSNDFDNTFRNLLKKLPSVITTFPLLFALAKTERDSIFKGKGKLLIVNDKLGVEDNLEFDFSKKTTSNGISNQKIDEYLLFFEKVGLKHMFLNLAESSIVDYVIGVLVGLDSNGRKNRGGDAFELACLPIIENITKKYNINLITQKQFKELKKYGYKIDSEIANRKPDFILFKDDKVLNIEVNYYNDSGSKPEEIIDSYINRERDLKKNNIHFAFITDGEKCWGSNTKSQLLKGFNNISYLMNFNLAKEGMLEEVIRKVFCTK